jgi:hypothetical protein
MKKIFTLLTILALAFSASAQKKIAYVSTATPAVNGDSLIRKELAKTYTIVDVNGTGTATAVKAACEAADIAMVILAEPLSSTATGVLGLQGINKPLLNMKVFAYKVNAAAWNWSATTLWGEDPTALTIDVPAGQATHPIYSGLTSPISLLSSVVSTTSGTIVGKGIDWANIPSTFLTSGTLTQLSTITGGTNTCILEISAGSTYKTTTNVTVTVPQTYIQFGINTISQPKITADGLKLVVNICDYLTKDYVVGVKNVKEIDFTAVAGKGVISVKSPMEGTVEIVNMAGTLLAKQSIVDEVSIAVPQGQYVVRVVSGNTVTAKKVLVK